MSFEPWEKDDMGIRRVGGEAVQLPNGDVILVGGAQVQLGRAWMVMMCVNQSLAQDH
jgi:hypothetical protein